ncbi:MAG: hypothetical protein DCC65_04570 [Planctomycetota bacterium]|nr:MAG: hypothetical protein DCC65_04570 [Planctomycetota bacterium]
MNKSSMFLGAALLAVVTSVTVAQESAIWMDARPNNAAGNSVNNITGSLGAVNPYIPDNVNGGRKGAGQILRLEPVHADSSHTANPTAFPNHDGDGDRSTGDLWVYVDMNDDAAGTGDVLASLGLDLDLTASGTLVRNTISAISFELFNDGSVFNSVTPTGGTPWNNKINGSLVAGSPPDWAGAKAVRVPVDPGPVYNASLGLQPNNGVGANTTLPYRVGKLRVTSGTRNCSFGAPFNANSTFTVKMKVNNLLVARVFNGAGDVPPQENISFGYDSLGAVELPTVSGSMNGATSALPDATIEIRMKGDFTGDGRVTGGDNGAYANAANVDASDNLLQTFCGDFTGDNRVTGGDTGGYNAATTASVSCP